MVEVFSDRKTSNTVDFYGRIRVQENPFSHSLKISVFVAFPVPRQFWLWAEQLSRDDRDRQQGEELTAGDHLESKSGDFVPRRTTATLSAAWRRHNAVALAFWVRSIDSHSSVQETALKYLADKDC